MNFPDTSNTRYQSYCEAAAVLLEYLPDFLQFLEFVCDRKEKRTFTHLELNFKNALMCQSTLTELAVLTMYSQAITHPYVRQIRGSGTDNINLLELGSLHEQVAQHMELIIQNPGMLISKDATAEIGAIDGGEWDRPGAVLAILNMAPTLPHLESALVAFFKGALGGWKRFTAEFDLGGDIDQSSDAQRELAWMSPTNDANEGILGAYRQFMHRKPRTTLYKFNSQLMYERNHTQEFMNKNFDENYNDRLMQVELSKRVRKP